MESLNIPESAYTTEGRKGEFMAVWGGGKFYLEDPRPGEVDYRDIAKSLSNICRYNGHVFFYSVAEHSVLMADHVDNISLKRALLFHDAAEAYTGDLHRPFKNFLQRFPEFAELEEKIEKAIFSKYGVSTDPVIKHMVKLMDAQMIVTEKQKLVPQKETWWHEENFSPLDVQLEYWSPEEAEYHWVNRFLELEKYRMEVTN
jgi:hypothetical protein